MQVVGDDVDAAGGGHLALAEGDGVGQDFEAVLVGPIGQGLQRPGVHARVVGRRAVAPAVGEGLDGVGLVGGDGLDGGAGAFRRIDPAGGGLVGPVGAVAHMFW